MSVAPEIALHKAELRLCIVVHWYVTSVCYLVHLQNSIFLRICQVKWKKTEKCTNPFFDFMQKRQKIEKSANKFSKNSCKTEKCVV